MDSIQNNDCYQMPNININIIIVDNMQIKYIHFIVYAVIFTFYGSIVTAVGPIIIYYSKVTEEDETYYSFIFMARAFGYFFGGFLAKQLTGKYKLHHIYIGLIIVCGVALIVSSYDFSFYNLLFTMLIAGACNCMINIVTNLCVFELFTDNQDYWLQLMNLFFGIGGLIGPVIVIFFQEQAFRVIGFSFFFMLIAFYFLQSPQFYRIIHSQHVDDKKHMSRTAEVCICLLFFFYIAEEVGYAGWIPTYAIKAGVANAKEASTLASIFWITNTIARIVLLYMPGTVTNRLYLLLRLLVLSTFIMVIFQFLGLYYFVTYAGVIASGAILSAMYALFYSFAQEYGYSLTTANTANFAMSASLGQGLLVMPIGYAMGYFGFQSLIIIIFLLSSVMMSLFIYVRDMFEAQSEQNKTEINIPLKQTHSL